MHFQEKWFSTLLPVFVLPYAVSDKSE